jgi:N-acetylneuraminate synthase
MGTLHIGGRAIGEAEPPLVIAEIGINHEGDVAKARRMIDEAAAAGCECVKFQCHVIDDEMIPAAGAVIPGNASESILAIMQRCALTEAEDRELKGYTERRGMIYLSTPFSRAAADRLRAMDLAAYKIGSGECNNYPLVRHIAAFGKPVILSTGMNDIDSIRPSVEILRQAGAPYALLHCTSMYPTPYDKVRLGGITDLRDAFPDAIVGLSDHSLGNYTCLAAVALGARVLERHFTADRTWPGPDVPISMDPAELRDLVVGSRAVFEALGGRKTILPEEQPTIDFAYACVVTTRAVRKDETLSRENTWVKRPGTGEIQAKDFERVLGRRAARDLDAHAQVSWADLR